MGKEAKQAWKVPGLTRWGIGGLLALAAVGGGLLAPEFLRGGQAKPEVSQALRGTEANPLGYQPPEWPEGIDVRSTLVRLSLGTAFVLGLSIVTLRLCRPWLGGPPRAQRGDGQLRLLETLPLGNRCCLHLVQAADRQMVVGVDSTGLKTLLALPDSFESMLKDARSGDSVEPLDANQATQERAVGIYRRAQLHS